MADRESRDLERRWWAEGTDECLEGWLRGAERAGQDVLKDRVRSLAESRRASVWQDGRIGSEEST